MITSQPSTLLTIQFSNKHFIKEKLDSGLICTLYVSLGGQLFDILTKGLANDSFQAITNKLGMENIYSPRGVLKNQNEL